MSKAENTTDYSKLAEKEATELHQNFAAWIEEKTGFAPDLKSVQLAVTLRMAFQASPENQAHLQDRKAEAARRKKASAAQKRAKLEAQLAKLKADLEKAEAEPTAEEMPAEKPAPAKKTAARKPAVAKVQDKPATARTGRPRKAAAKTTPDVPEDFDRVELDEPAAKPVRRTRRAATTTK